MYHVQFSMIEHCEMCLENYTISADVSSPTAEPTKSPTGSPITPTTQEPTRDPTMFPTNVPTGSPTKMPTSGSIKLHMECYENSCSNTVIDIQGSIQSAHIHCAVEDACQGMLVKTDAMGSGTDVSITCYVLNACTDLNITAGDEYVQLHMYKYSQGIHLYNGFGWSFDDNTITCDRTHNFIMYNWNTSDNSDVKDLVDAEYVNEPFPCEGIVVHCFNQTDGVLDGSCDMGYVVDADVDLESYKFGVDRPDGNEWPQCI